MTLSEKNLLHLIEKAPELNAKFLEKVSPTQAHFEMQVVLADDSSKVYHLSIEAIDSYVRVKEKSPQHLPGFCPERHINPSGSFCLGWSGGEYDLGVTSPATALAWWSRLHRFLALQVRAEKRKTWPGEEWVHGEAVYFQKAAEKAAQTLGPDFTSWLKQGRLKVVLQHKVGPKGSLLKLYLGARHLCSVWGGLDMVANKRQRCLCQPRLNHRPKRMRSCKDHAQQIKTLITSIYYQERELEDFWRDYEGIPCCNTMKHCPLKDSAT